MHLSVTATVDRPGLGGLADDGTGRAPPFGPAGAVVRPGAARRPGVADGVDPPLTVLTGVPP
ncbi:hypothetical protein [Blastococcus deserti]|uniref:Uncharacterized protein n=1 Tax=Blastococcus deserti TaxID=2259033 RepID=A0ABW4XEJ2_9ACTN